MLPTKLRGFSKKSHKNSLREKIKKVTQPAEGLIKKVVKNIKGIKNK